MVRTEIFLILLIPQPWSFKFSQKWATHVGHNLRYDFFIKKILKYLILHLPTNRNVFPIDMIWAPKIGCVFGSKNMIWKIFWGVNPQRINIFETISSQIVAILC